MTGVDRPEVTLCGWQDVTSSWGLTSTATSYGCLGTGGSGGGDGGGWVPGWGWVGPWVGPYVLPPTRYWVPMSYHLLAILSPPEWLCIQVGSCVSHFNVSLTVRAKSQDSVHKPPFFLKRKESRSGSNRGPSAYQPSALPLGHTGSRFLRNKHFALVSTRPPTYM